MHFIPTATRILHIAAATFRCHVAIVHPLPRQHAATWVQSFCRLTNEISKGVAILRQKRSKPCSGLRMQVKNLCVHMRNWLGAASLITICSSTDHLGMEGPTLHTPIVVVLETQNLIKHAFLSVRVSKSALRLVNSGCAAAGDGMRVPKSGPVQCQVAVRVLSTRPPPPPESQTPPAATGQSLQQRGGSPRVSQAGRKGQTKRGVPLDGIFLQWSDAHWI